MLLDRADRARGLPARKELLERYASASGRDLGQIDFYVAFGYWKLACIVEGVYARYVGGAMGSRPGLRGLHGPGGAPAPSRPPRPWGGSDEATRR